MSEQLDWGSPATARHAVRVLCDDAGLSLVPSFEVDGRLYIPKDVICAVLEVESGFYNYLPSGEPTMHQNLRKDGSVGSTDWGIGQINDRYHIGPALDFSSVQYVMANPAEVIKFVIRMFRAGRIGLWCAYANGSFKRHLPA